MNLRKSFLKVLEEYGFSGYGEIQDLLDDLEMVVEDYIEYEGLA
jgi:hypothetical protein